MYNSRPFDILLDMYSTEAYQLYCVVQSLFDYPAIVEEDSEEENCDGKLYASAFAKICSNYFTEYLEMYPHDDFRLFVEQMNFEVHKIEINKLIQKWPPKGEEAPLKLSFDTKVSELIHVYRKQLVNDIQTHFPTKDLQLRLFASIFTLADKRTPSSSTYYVDTDFLL
ncbi:hypothetical protein QNI19_12110 [Cytophagaceae bacterium DM2B3-1]|uniref:Uncharacterized protein n=1 Tax=Xanthocytophaga flava TaxID=3048013 RepID=A0ABT7CIZ9_9BACT|nr:hypothetical protein [Xanthocytophaga flavus]MDJ1493677.1 hypothetical protein [Xanthocytophaga flavus]